MELGDRMDLSSYLLKPIQRMGKYSLLLEQLLKECDSKDANYNSLKVTGTTLLNILHVANMAVLMYWTKE